MLMQRLQGHLSTTPLAQKSKRDSLPSMHAGLPGRKRLDPSGIWYPCPHQLELPVELVGVELRFLSSR